MISFRRNSSSTSMGDLRIRFAYNGGMRRNRESTRTLLDEAKLSACIARTPDEVRAAQRLRHQVFAEEMHAQLGTTEEGLDADAYDPHCEHLLVHDGRTREVVGTYRILPADRARRAGGFYSETEFDLGAVAGLPGLVEIGRACVHPDYRNGAVIRLLWAGLTRYLLGHGYEFVIGCASMPAEDARTVRAVHRELARDHLSPAAWRVQPRVPFPVREEPGEPDVALPPLIKGYVRLGAYVCGDPGWDVAFGTADFFMMLPLVRLKRRYAARFARAA
jgi:putative hemolysin